MSRAEDVNTLFRRFGGDAGTYQEIVATQQVDSAVSKWPMLDQIRVQITPTAPSASLAGMAQQERFRQAMVAPAPSTPVAVPEGGAAMAPVVGRSVPSAVSHAPRASAPQGVAAVPEAPPMARPVEPVVAEAVAPERAGLQSMFRRMVGQRPTPASAGGSNPLKRLIKW
jgi:hypothetical protein